MWGSDFPHDEGTYPHTREALAHAFEGVPEDEVARMVGENAAALYGFDLDALTPLAQEFGPSRKAIMEGSDIPAGSESLAFEERVATVS